VPLGQVVQYVMKLQTAHVGVQFVTPGHVQTLRMRLLEGRDFDGVQDWMAKYSADPRVLFRSRTQPADDVEDFSL
jgi:hypothetical protein